MTFDLPDVDATMSLGRWIGERAFAGAWIALIGDLGAGKTALVKGLGQGLGVNTVVQSPTFVLVQAHEGRLPLWHADLYRLEDPREVEALALHEFHDGVVAIEWADRFPEVLPDDFLRVRLVDLPEGGRRAFVEATGPEHARMVPGASDVS